MDAPYIYATKATATKAKYCQRLRAFLEFIGYKDDAAMPCEDNARAIAEKVRDNNVYAFKY